MNTSFSSMLMHSHDMYKDKENFLQPHKRMQSIYAISFYHMIMLGKTVPIASSFTVLILLKQALKDHLPAPPNRIPPKKTASNVSNLWCAICFTQAWCVCLCQFLWWIAACKAGEAGRSCTPDLGKWQIFDQFLSLKVEREWSEIEQRESTQSESRPNCRKSRSSRNTDKSEV